MLLPLLNRLFSGKISMVALTAGLAAYQRGDRPTARRLIAIASSAAPRDGALHDRASFAAAQAGDHRMALDLLAGALRADPANDDLQLRAAMTQCALGDEQGAAQRCEETIARITDRDPGRYLMHLLAKLRLPGPSCHEVLAAIHNWLRPRTYVEIGVETGNSIALASPATRAIGIDPTPLISRPLSPNTTIYAETSDDFFARRDVRALLGGLPVEFALVDGMHLFDFVLRDFINLERHCAAGSTILLDDCYPLERRSADRSRTTNFWTGDVWRVIPALKKYRPDLRIHTIAAAPTGLCVVRGLDPSSRALSEHYDAIVKEFLALDYSAVESD
ncbi:MAG: class I SAM-dependent methyltransferase, partial [Burkholderiales bacterium]